MVGCPMSISIRGAQCRWIKGARWRKKAKGGGVWEGIGEEMRNRHRDHYYCPFCRENVLPVCTPTRGRRRNKFTRTCDRCGGKVQGDTKKREKVPLVDGAIRV